MKLRGESAGKFCSVPGWFPVEVIASLLLLLCDPIAVSSRNDVSDLHAPGILDPDAVSEIIVPTACEANGSVGERRIGSFLRHIHCILGVPMMLPLSSACMRALSMRVRSKSTQSIASTANHSQIELCGTLIAVST